MRVNFAQRHQALYVSRAFFMDDELTTTSCFVPDLRSPSLLDVTDL